MGAPAHRRTNTKQVTTHLIITITSAIRATMGDPELACVRRGVRSEVESRKYWNFDLKCGLEFTALLLK